MLMKRKVPSSTMKDFFHLQMKGKQRRYWLRDGIGAKQETLPGL
jgi:hypothetical protein